MPGARVAEGDHVTLRTIEEEDIPFLQRHTANRELRIPLVNEIHNQSELEDAVADNFGDQTPVLICLDGEQAGPGVPAEGDVRRIGAASVGDEGIARPSIAYYIVPEYQGEGYGTEAVSLLVDHVFREFHHGAVGAKVFPENDASRGLLESLGFTQEGRMRNRLFWNGEYRDQLVYGLLREEWETGD